MTGQTHIGCSQRRWVARNIDNNELVALIHSRYDVPDENNTPVTNVLWLVVKALDIHMKHPWIEISSDFVVAEWETWYAFKLVPVIKITKAGTAKAHRWETTVED